MAEHVQAAMDRMVEPLADLQNRSIFSPEEIQAVVARRRQSEYKLRRRAPRKSDFIAYLQSEESLEDLRKLRTKRVKPSPGVGDSHILQNLHLLWIRTLRKYKADSTMYYQYAEFCKRHKNYKRLSMCYAEAIRFHPKECQFWIDAASHELFESNNAPAARILLQRGLRFNETSRDLWIQSCAVELHMRQKLWGRKVVLELGKNDSSDDVGYGVATMVYEHAIKSQADSLELRLEFLELFRGFPETGELQNTVLESITDDYGESSEQAWISKAYALVQYDEGVSSKGDGTTLASTAKKDYAVLDCIRNAVSTVKTEEMVVQAVHFLLNYLSNLDCEEHVVVDRHDKTHTLIRELLRDCDTTKLVLLHANYAKEHSDDGTDEAVRILKESIYSKEEPASSALWIEWAMLVSEKEAGKVLRRALKRIPVSHRDHALILLQLVGFKLKCEQTVDEDIRALLLMMPLKPFCVGCTCKNIPTAIRMYLQSKLKTGEAAWRLACDQIVLGSSMPLLCCDDPATMRSVVEDCLSQEVDRERLGRFYDVAARLLGSEYRQRRDEHVKYNTAAFAKNVSDDENKIPTLDCGSSEVDTDLVTRLYGKHQILLLKNVSTRKRKRKIMFDHTSLAKMYEGLDDKDKASWCWETGPGGCDSSTTAADFLKSEVSRKRAYCSFLVQHDQETYSQTVEILPFQDFLGSNWKYQQALWFFFGKNPLGNQTLDGRSEHTDSVTHDGTWHYQLSGRKLWFVRPSSDRSFPNDCEEPLQIDCAQGDVLIINTRLWHHRTTIPPQRSPSVSYARDFVTDQSNVDLAISSEGMKNVDGLYATNDIDEGTIIFHESDMPDCALHRSVENPNCEIVELQDGNEAVVSSRFIASGEFFCIPESDSEDASVGDA